MTDLGLTPNIVAKITTFFKQDNGNKIKNFIFNFVFLSACTIFR